MTRYRYRKYEPGDEHAINQLYLAVTGRKRTVDQFMWQWQNAPGGKGDIWLIEHTRADGSAELIGHHGIMPIIFSYGQDDFLAGKTENTMVLPEFRAKILYPKFEKIFLSHYEKRFDLLFSTMGPPAAIRQRLMQGYEANKKWLHFAWVLGPGAIFSRMAFLFASRHGRMGYKTVSQLCALIGKTYNKLSRPPFSRTQTAVLQILSPEEAKQHPFFLGFWDTARHEYGLTPRRNREDLQWKFWDNPYGVHMTLLYEGAGDGSGYVIVRDLGNQSYRMEDIVLYPITQELFKKILNAACKWVLTQGGNILYFDTVDDNHKITQMFQKFHRPDLCKKLPFSFIKQTDAFMPRKITRRSRIITKHNEIDWYITPFVFEGRM